MPLTKKEQTIFEQMFEKIQDVHPDSKFVGKLGDLIFSLTGSVNLAMRMFNLSERMKKKGRRTKKCA